MALWLCIGRLFPSEGGDSAAVRHQLVDVCSVCSSAYAFAALKHDGSVVCWGDSNAGGDSTAVQERLYRVTHIPDSFKYSLEILLFLYKLAWAGFLVLYLWSSTCVSRLCMDQWDTSVLNPISLALGRVVKAASLCWFA